MKFVGVRRGVFSKCQSMRTPRLGSRKGRTARSLATLSSERGDPVYPHDQRRPKRPASYRVLGRDPRPSSSSPGCLSRCSCRFGSTLPERSHQVACRDAAPGCLSRCSSIPWSSYHSTGQEGLAKDFPDGEVKLSGAALLGMCRLSRDVATGVVQCNTEVFVSVTHLRYKPRPFTG